MITFLEREACSEQIATSCFSTNFNSIKTNLEKGNIEYFNLINEYKSIRIHASAFSYEYSNLSLRNLIKKLKKYIHLFKLAKDFSENSYLVLNRYNKKDSVDSFYIFQTKKIFSNNNVKLFMWNSLEKKWIILTRNSIEFQNVKLIKVCIKANENDAFVSYLKNSDEENNSAKLDSEVADLARLDLSDLREDRVAFVVYQKHKDCLSDDELKHLSDLTIKHIRSHLYFFKKGALSRIDQFEEGLFSLTKFKSNGFEKIVFVPIGLFIQSETCINELLINAVIFKDCLTHYYKEKYLEGLFVLNIESDISYILDIPMKGIDIKQLKKILSSHVINTKSVEGKVINSIAEGEVDSEIVEAARNNLDDHFSEGFESIFLFNTEFYTEISDNLDKVSNLKTLIGLSSGFKLNYLASKSNAEKVIYFDLNSDSLSFKKKLLEGWNGIDLPSWIKKNNYQKRYKFVENSIKYIEKSWSRELDRWGGAEVFYDNWTNYKKLEFSFNHIDCINEIEKLSSLLDCKQAALWISNVWNNEFVYYAFGSNMQNEYLKWLNIISKTNKDLIVFQSEVFFEENVFFETGESSSAILGKLKRVVNPDD